MRGSYHPLYNVQNAHYTAYLNDGECGGKTIAKKATPLLAERDLGMNSHTTEDHRRLNTHTYTHTHTHTKKIRGTHTRDYSGDPGVVTMLYR